MTLKLATSLDGRIATAAGESQWITGSAAREQVHVLRSQHDAILIGIETALADDPLLSVRLADWRGAQPARVVLDTRQRLPLDSQLVRTAPETATYLITTGTPDAMLVGAGVRVLQVPGAGQDRPEPGAIIAALRRANLSRLFIEGGGRVAASFLRGGLVDALEWFRAPILLGEEGRPGIGAMAIAELAGAPHFQRVEVLPLGVDLWERYARI